MKYYCNKCFNSIEYKFSLPEYCPFCKSNIAKAKIIHNKKNTDEKANEVKKPVRSYSNDDSDILDEDEYTFEGEIPKIKAGSGVKVEIPAAATSVTFGQIFENQNVQKTQNPDNSMINNNKIMEDLKKESSNSGDFFDVN